jgi:hypothetical protein
MTKFSIRDLFLVTMIVAVCVAWWMDHRRQAQVIGRLTGEWRFTSTTTSISPGVEILLNSSAPAPNPPKP